MPHLRRERSGVWTYLPILCFGHRILRGLIVTRKHVFGGLSASWSLSGLQRLRSRSISSSSPLTDLGLFCGLTTISSDARGGLIPAKREVLDGWLGMLSDRPLADSRKR